MLSTGTGIQFASMKFGLTAVSGQLLSNEEVRGNSSFASFCVLGCESTALMCSTKLSKLDDSLCKVHSDWMHVGAGHQLMPQFLQIVREACHSTQVWRSV